MHAARLNVPALDEISGGGLRLPASASRRCLGRWSSGLPSAPLGLRLRRRNWSGRLAQPECLCKDAALCGVVWGNHRVVAREAPLRPVFVWREVLSGLKVPLQHLELFAIYQADQVGHSRIVYVVESVAEAYGYGGPPHVRLVADGQNDGMLMSVSALLDDYFWSRIPPERN
jgi:hypothetical protein